MLLVRYNSGGICLQFLHNGLDVLLSNAFSFKPQSTAKIRAHGIGTVSGRLLLGTAEKIPLSELIDSTGAGDSFIGAVLYGTSEPFIFIRSSILSHHFLHYVAKASFKFSDTFFVLNICLCKVVSILILSHFFLQIPGHC